MKNARQFLSCILALCLGFIANSQAWASIYGTMSNFDTYNETPDDSYGAEIELEGIDSSDISRTYPSHYDSETRNNYSDSSSSGVRITYMGYNFSPSGFLPANTAGVNTNGHTCVGTQGCEHFGFSVTGVQPTAARFYWLDQNGNRIGVMPESIATPTWGYVPPAAGGLRRVRARVEAPEAPEIIEQRPDSIWMKVYKTDIDRPVDLLELLSDNAVIPDSIGETETEWELLEGGMGKFKEKEADVDEDDFAVVRRYEFFEYTGAYDAEHEPITLFLDKGDLPEDLTEPPADELGQFISANMVAANLAAPEEGDFDQDDDVDGVDFLAWQLGFQAGNKLGDGDADWDDEVDNDDLQIWEDQFAAGQAPFAAGAAVPEPSSIVLLCLASAGLILGRKRLQ